MASRISNRISINSTREFTLSDLEEFVSTLKAVGASGETTVSVDVQHPDRPGELSTYQLSADVLSKRVDAR